MTIRIRHAEDTDVEALAALNVAAYPDLAQEGVVFSAAQIRGHLARFPDGQLVALDDGVLAGAISTLVLPNAIDPLAPHTWLGVTDHGSYERHDPTGDTLYLADIYVHPGAWGRGVGRALYGALFELCRRRGHARVVGGGRMDSFVDAPEAMSPRDYIAAVVAGRYRDRVLQSQLRAGFEVRGVLPGYLHDGRSRHCATLIVWDNPDVVKLQPAVARRPSERANDQR
jgi:GNAT superfamily N-acetyltransferase